MIAFIYGIAGLVLQAGRRWPKAAAALLLIAITVALLTHAGVNAFPATEATPSPSPDGLCRYVSEDWSSSHRDACPAGVAPGSTLHDIGDGFYRVMP